MIGLIWMVFDRFNEDAFRLRIELRPKGLCAWDPGLYIDPSHRGGLAFARLWDAAGAPIRNDGVRWTFGRLHGKILQCKASIVVSRMDRFHDMISIMR
ncbi:MAG: hypothetical protein WD673_14810 [Alphaproteobacteria bacterium]